MAVHVTVRYHAGARELVGLSSESLELPEGSTNIASLFDCVAKQHPALTPFRERLRFALNGELVANDAAVSEGDEVDVMPPMAGGEGPVWLSDIRTSPLSIDEAYRAVAHSGAGGVAIFVGVVRDHADGEPVNALSYEAHETMAHKELRRTLDEVAEEHAGTRLAAVHRVGDLSVGDLAVVVAASAPHRADAFAACRAAIDRIKENVPIWKKEFRPDGRTRWVDFEVLDAPTSAPSPSSGSSAPEGGET